MDARPTRHYGRAMINEPKKERIAKLLARAGIGSRRGVEAMIAEGRIALAGRVLDSPATLVADLDGITVDGEPVQPIEPVQLWRYHKPAGLVVSHHDPQGRPTVFAKLPPGLPRVISVGRLDVNSEGLLLLTNDGALARHLELPATGLARRYRVRVHGRIDEAALAALAEGVTVDGMRYGPIAARLERRQGANAWLEVSLNEGKNREVRKVMAHLGLDVSRLIRIAYGPFLLGRLAPGEVAAVPRKDWIAIAEPVLKQMQLPAAPGKPARPKGWAKAKPKPTKPPRRQRR